MGGKPVITGTRMPVELVLAKLAANPDLEEFFLDYPELTVEDVRPSWPTPARWWLSERNLSPLASTGDVRSFG
jgi:uncharacterized protein (DUF433 family)